MQIGQVDVKLADFLDLADTNDDEPEMSLVSQAGSHCVNHFEEHCGQSDLSMLAPDQNRQLTGILSARYLLQFQMAGDIIIFDRRPSGWLHGHMVPP